MKKNYIDILAHFFKWIDGWLTLIDSIICIISLGLLHISVSWKFTLWYTPYIAKLRKRCKVKKELKKIKAQDIKKLKKMCRGL